MTNEKQNASHRTTNEVSNFGLADLTQQEMHDVQGGGWRTVVGVAICTSNPVSLAGCAVGYAIWG